MPGVAIPTIDQTVSTPSFSVGANPFHAEPLESNVGPALAQADDALHGIWKVQQDHANTIDTSKRMGNYLAQAGQAKVAALNSGQQGPDMIANYGKALTAIQSQTIDGTEDPAHPNPPNPAVARELQLATAQHIGQETGGFPSEATTRVFHDLDFKFGQQNSAAAAQIGQQYKIGGTPEKPSFDFTPEGGDAARRAQNSINQAYPPDARPTENQFYSSQLRQKIALQTGMMVAQDHPTLLKSYTNQHAAFLTPEQQGMLTNRANEAMLAPMHQIEADGKATEANTYNDLLKAKSDGTLSDSEVIAKVNAFQLPRELGEQLIGRQIEPQTNPATFNAVRTNLDAAGTPEEIEMNLAGVGTPGSGINSTDAAKLRAYGAGLKPVLNDPIKAADRLYSGADGWIAGQYRPKDYPSAIMGSMDPTIKNNAAAAQNYYAVYKDIVAQGLPPDKAIEAKRALAAKAVELYPMPAPLMTKPGDAARVMALPPEIVRRFDPNSGGVPPMGVAR